MRKIPGLALVLFALGFAACKDDPPREGPRCPEPTDRSAADAAAPAARSIAPWPTLPRTPDAVQRLASTTTTRPSRYARPVKELDATVLFAKLGATGLARAIAGKEAIRRALVAKVGAGGGDGYLLVGGNHDSREQVEAFRRLVEIPGSYTHVGLEVLAADGHWSGVPDADQRGATAELEAYLARGDAASLAALGAAHEASDYAAWKLGFAEAAVDLAVAARAGAFALVPLDMPTSVKAPLHDLGDALLDVREMHASFTLRGALGGARPARVAMLLGDAHVGQGGLGRFLPRDAAVVTVHLLGGRHRASATATAPKVVLDAPVLFPRDEASDELVLVLPDTSTAGDVDRVRTREGAAGETEVSFAAEGGGTLHVGGTTHPLGPKPTRVALAEGAATYVLEGKDGVVVGALDVARGARIEVRFDASRRTTRIEERLPLAAPR